VEEAVATVWEEDHTTDGSPCPASCNAEAEELVVAAHAGVEAGDALRAATVAVASRAARHWSERSLDVHVPCGGEAAAAAAGVVAATRLAPKRTDSHSEDARAWWACAADAHWSRASRCGLWARASHVLSDCGGSKRNTRAPRAEAHAGDARAVGRQAGSASRAQRPEAHTRVAEVVTKDQARLAAAAEARTDARGAVAAAGLEAAAYEAEGWSGSAAAEGECRQAWAAAAGLAEADERGDGAAEGSAFFSSP